MQGNENKRFLKKIDERKRGKGTVQKEEKKLNKKERERK